MHRSPAASSRWVEAYGRKLTSAGEAIRAIRSGDRVWIQPGCSNPEPLVRAMVARADELRDVEVVHLLTLGVAPYADARYAASFRHRSLFTGENVREAVNEGLADRKSTRLNSSHSRASRMPSSA